VGVPGVLFSSRHARKQKNNEKESGWMLPRLATAKASGGKNVLQFLVPLLIF